MTMFFIGADDWSGIAKLMEEAGEVVQVCGKLIAISGASNHWDGSNLHVRLEEELGDLLAAISFVIGENLDKLSPSAIENRRREKLTLFDEWQATHTHDSLVAKIR